MALDLKQIKEILQKPSKQQLIKKAKSLQKRLRFHTESNVSMSDISQPASEFLDWVKHLLPADKYNVFLQLFKFPLPTNATAAKTINPITAKTVLYLISFEILA